MIKTIIEGLEVAANGIENVQKIVAAIREGKEYLTTKHPELRGHIVGMLDEMRKTMLALAECSTVITEFRFVESNASLVSFNEECQRHKVRAIDLEQRLDAIRGHCSKIRDYAFSMDLAAIQRNSHFEKIISLLRLHSPERERTLAAALDRLSYEEKDYDNAAVAMLASVNLVLVEVQDALGEVMSKNNIMPAAHMLKDRRVQFEPLEARANKAARDIRDIITELNQQANYGHH